ncbi:LysR family transcriptional regulator [Roseobacter weihaiensis]|uniref:LysR family transcriptional regulator n=1 Tax=Roseobacter weihaiensis TaxID=2763262 RepID=UPI0029CABCA6|nr:LysR family transcriptional regulator [Roseobacter sp. H9]
MKKPLPPVTWFRAFDATARHLSFTLAAQELGFTQSAISQNVRALEQKLGTPLFVRGHRALSLTQAGRLLVPDVAAAIAQLEQAPALTDGRLVTLPLPNFPARERYYLAQRTTQNPEAQARFIDWFKSAATEKP